MTWTTDATTSPQDVRPARLVRSARTRRALVGALVGAVVLGAAAAAVVATRDVPVSAAVLVVTSPDPASVENPANPTLSGDQNARNATYLETELLYLSGADLAGQVAAQVDGGTPDLDATRVSDSNVIQITATASSGDEATAQAQAAADIYVESRQGRLQSRIDAQLAAVEQQLTATAAAQAALGTPPAEGIDPQAQQRTILGAQYADQLTVRDTLQRATADVPGVASQVQAASVLPAGAVPSWLLVAVLAAGVGALVGALVPGLVRRADGRVRDEEDVASLGVPIISPTLPTREAQNRSRKPGTVLARAIQLQALRMPSGPLAGGTLVVLAPTTGVGTTFTALEHARHAARRGPTLLVCATGPVSEDLAAIGVSGDHIGLVDLVPPPGETVSTDDLTRASQSTQVPDLRVLTPGSVRRDDPRTAERVISAGLVRSAAAAGWAVVVDSAPLDRSDMGLQLARQCDEAVVVVATRRSTVPEIVRTLEIMRSAAAPLTGVIINQPPRRAVAAATAEEPARAESRRQPREQAGRA